MKKSQKANFLLYKKHIEFFRMCMNGSIVGIDTWMRHEELLTNDLYDEFQVNSKTINNLKSAIPSLFVIISKTNNIHA